MSTRARRIYTLVAGALLALLAMELVIRQSYTIAYSHEPGYGPIYTPGSTIRWSVEGRGVGHWTVHGLRGSAPPNLARDSLLVLGDSFTEAPMVYDDEVFPQQLEMRLGGRFQVLNAGRGMSSIADYVAYAPRHLGLFHPRWTIIELSDDDLGAGAWDDDEAAHLVREGAALKALPRVESPLTWYALSEEKHNPLRHVMLLRYAILRYVLSQHQPGEPPLFRAGTPPPRSAPPPPQMRYPVEEELQLAVDTYRGRVTLFYFSQFAPREPETERRTREACEAHGWSCVFLRQAFPALAGTGTAPYGFPNTAFNSGHPNRLGHRLAAELLEQEIERLTKRGLL
ncbi:MAG: hydrolase family protein [bacterium]|nr:hydrolase family protein [bacterium]